MPSFERFVAWVGALTKAPLEVIAIDGKTSRRSGRKGGKETIHMVSAFAARQRLVLAQTKVSEKSNEIVAIPALKDMLSIDGAVVTIDAMGCQREIARKIVDQKADYVLALKGNQGTLRDDVELFANEQKAKGFADTTISVARTVDGDHGRIETRNVTVVHDVAWLQERHQWPGLRGLVIVEAMREIGPKTEPETRFYLTSSQLRADKLGPMVRDHWGVENGLHWVMDMTFRDDECRIRTENAPENVVTLKHIALNLARRKKGKDSVRLALKTAAWDDDFLTKLIAASFLHPIPLLEQGRSLAEDHARPVRLGGQAGERQLLQGPVLPPASPTRPAKSHLRRRGVDPDRRLSHAQGRTFHHDLGAAYFDRRAPEAKVKRLARQIARLGYDVTLRPSAKAAWKASENRAESTVYLPVSF